MAEDKVSKYGFKEGLNTDFAHEYVPPGFYIYALNIKNSASGEGNKGVVTNIKGNLSVTTPLPDGLNFTIGSAPDREKNRFFWFVFNSNFNHCIMMFDELTRTVTPVFVNLVDSAGVDILKLDRNFLINHIDIIGDKMFWVDGLNPARKTNISKMLDKSITGYGTVVEDFINAYKKSFSYAPKVEYFSDNSKKYNRLYGAIRRFTARPRYDDFELGNYSDFSEAALPKKEFYLGENIIPQDNNGIKITIRTGDKTVTDIEIAMQSTDATLIDGVLPWVTIATLNKKSLGIPDNSEYIYNFYNNDGDYPIALYTEIIRPYSFLPRIPFCQALLENVIAYANGISGYGKLDIDIDISVTYEDLFISNDTANEFNDPLFTTNQLDSCYNGIATYVHLDGTNELVGPGGTPTPVRAVLQEMTVGNDVKRGNKFIIQASNGGPDDFLVSYVANITDSTETVVSKLKQLLISTGKILRRVDGSPSESLPDTNIYNNVTDGGGNITFKFIIRGSRNAQRITFATSVNPIQFNTLKDSGNSIQNEKSGCTKKYGITYEDEYKSLVYTDNSCVVTYKTVNELDGLKAQKLSLTINHLPPKWAKYYQIVRSRDLVYEDYIQLLIQNVVNVPGSTGGAETEYLDLVVGSLYTYQKLHPNTTIKYEFTKGDRLRLIKKTSDGEYYPFYETEILNYQDIVTDRIDSNLTTDGTNEVIVKETDSGNIGKIIEFDGGGSRKIIDVVSGTKYLLDAEIGDIANDKIYLFYDLVDNRGTVRIRKPNSESLPSGIENLSLVELYKPSRSSQSEDTKQFYEFQQKFPIINPGTDSAYHSANKQNQTNSLPAILEISSGTAYVRSRELPVNNTFPGPQVVIELIEDPSFSDFYSSLMNDDGRANAEFDGIGETNFTERIWYSNNAIQGTKLQGYNSFDNLSREDYNDEYGSIKRIDRDMSDLIICKALKTGYIPLNARLTQDEAGNSLRIATSKFLNDIQYFQEEGGIGDNPESYSNKNKAKYFVSTNLGAYVRISRNGEELISKTFFFDKETKEQLISANKYGSKIFTQYDDQLSSLFVAISSYDKNIYKGGFNGWQILLPIPDPATQFELITPAVHGDVTLTAPNVAIWVPDSNYVGSDSFTYRYKLPGGEWSDPIKVCISAVEPANRLKGWKGTTPFCVIVDGDIDGGIRNGYQGWITLSEFYLDDNSLTGITKPNVVTDPDYIQPVYNTTACSLQYWNVKKQQLFTKDDCDPGESGSGVLYVISAKTYKASSQMAADALALADIAANGQAYANDNGTCSVGPSYYEVSDSFAAGTNDTTSCANSLGDIPLNTLNSDGILNIGDTAYIYSGGAYIAYIPTGGNDRLSYFEGVTRIWIQLDGTGEVIDKGVCGEGPVAYNLFPSKEDDGEGNDLVKVTLRNGFTPVSVGSDFTFDWQINRLNLPSMSMAIPLSGTGEVFPNGATEKFLASYNNTLYQYNGTIISNISPSTVDGHPIS